jgi:hypothetical protein
MHDGAHRLRHSLQASMSLPIQMRFAGESLGFFFKQLRTRDLQHQKQKFLSQRSAKRHRFLLTAILISPLHSSGYGEGSQTRLVRVTFVCPAFLISLGPRSNREGVSSSVPASSRPRFEPSPLRAPPAERLGNGKLFAIAGVGPLSHDDPTALDFVALEGPPKRGLSPAESRIRE